jgi:hypothetical protein
MLKRSRRLLISFQSPWLLPLQGRRAKGYEGTFVNGTQIVSCDEFTGEPPGKLLRGRL